MHKTDDLKNPVIVFLCKNCGCTTKIRVASFENPDLDIPENNVIACYRCRAEVAGSEFISWKEATKTIFTVEVPECGSRVENHDKPVLREEIFDD